MPRMRTIEQAAAYVHEKDRQSALTKTAIRRLVITGTIPSCKIGSKYLINLDKLEEVLTAGTTVMEHPGKIRKVS